MRERLARAVDLFPSHAAALQRLRSKEQRRGRLHATRRADAVADAAPKAGGHAQSLHNVRTIHGLSLKTTPCAPPQSRDNAVRANQSQDNAVRAGPQSQDNAVRATPVSRQRRACEPPSLKTTPCAPPQSQDNAVQAKERAVTNSHPPPPSSHPKRRRGAPRSGGRLPPQPPASEPSCGASRSPHNAPSTTTQQLCPLSSPASATRDARRAKRAPPFLDIIEAQSLVAVTARR